MIERLMCAARNFRSNTEWCIQYPLSSTENDVMKGAAKASAQVVGTCLHVMHEWQQYTLTHRPHS